MGYEKQSVPVKAGAPMHITLQEEATQMGEVVVVGYGVQKKVNLTGAVSQISGDAIADKAAPNVLASLQGELPGVVVTQSSGQPGEGFRPSDPRPFLGQYDFDAGADRRYRGAISICSTRTISSRFRC